MANSGRTTLDYKPRLTDEEAYEKLPPTLRKLLQERESQMANMTKEQIRAIGTAELRAIVRSTVSTPSSRYWMELQWARDELGRRDRLRESVKKAVTGLGGTVTGRSFDHWRDLANCHVMWRITDDQAERAVLLDKIAAKCCELERKGEIASIWHATALVTGRPCNCGQCAVED